MSAAPSGWRGTFAAIWVVAAMAHAGALHAVAGSTTPSTLLAPGPHLAPSVLLRALAFVGLRVFVHLTWPAALAALACALPLWTARRRTSGDEMPRT